MAERTTPTRELLDACVHCGLCQQSCPTYLETGREAESPRGRIHLLTGWEEGRWGAEAVTPHLDPCLGCRACETACPSGVRYGALLERARDRLGREANAPPRSGLERWLVRHVLWRGRLLERVAGPARRSGLVRMARELSASSRLPESLRRRLALLPDPEAPLPPSAPQNPVRGAPPVHVLPGCVARAAFPATETAILHLLALAGYPVVRADSTGCCGALARHVGETRHAEALEQHLATQLPGDAEILVPTAAGCGAHLRDHPPSRSGGTPYRIADMVELLVSPPRPLAFHTRPGRVAWIDPCHLKHGQGIAAAPRSLLRATGATVIELAESDICCGSAGTYNLAQPAMAHQLGQRKAQAIRDAGVDTVVTHNPGCFIQVQAALGAGGPSVVSLPRYLYDRVIP